MGALENSVYGFLDGLFSHPPEPVELKATDFDPREDARAREESQDDKPCNVSGHRWSAWEYPTKKGYERALVRGEV